MSCGSPTHQILPSAVSDRGTPQGSKTQDSGTPQLEPPSPHPHPHQVPQAQQVHRLPSPQAIFSFSASSSPCSDPWHHLAGCLQKPHPWPPSVHSDPAPLPLKGILKPSMALQACSVDRGLSKALPALQPQAEHPPPPPRLPETLLHPQGLVGLGSVPASLRLLITCRSLPSSPCLESSLFTSLTPQHPADLSSRASAVGKRSLIFEKLS